LRSVSAREETAGLGAVRRLTERRQWMSLWLLILIVVLIALALGGFGYRRYY
jgi:hypothetical protein